MPPKQQTPAKKKTPLATKKASLRDPYVLPYPRKDKLFVQLPMGGNTEEDEDFKIEIQTSRIRAWMRIPSELQSAVDLLGEDGSLSPGNPETCPHCMVLQAAIDERIHDTKETTKKDEEGGLWVLEYDIATPFEVLQDYYDKEGSTMDTFLVQANGLGFTYAQFWLKAVPKQEDRAQHQAGKRVGKAARSGDDVSMSEWTEETIYDSAFDTVQDMALDSVQEVNAAGASATSCRSLIVSETDEQSRRPKKLWKFEGDMNEYRGNEIEDDDDDNISL